MTQRTRPTTLHHLMAHSAGMPMTHRELLAFKRQPGSRQSPVERALRQQMARTPDRPLTDEEAKGLRIKRVNAAEAARANPPTLDHGVRFPVYELDGDGMPKHDADGRLIVAGWRMPEGEKTVGYYRRAVRRLERWAMRAEREGLDKSKPPAQIARYAMDVVRMVADNAKPSEAAEAAA